ncbi:restriction endonuclease subunit S [Lutimonas vermicola]|uniref:Restriction endonuclease subunit S n=1 Tax=Lutimonas vermicola TaxID=414288 RepID=A0ABU9L4Y5_9FLAO
MKSSYKRLGDFIHKIDVRNKNSQNIKLLGLSMTKKFRPHASNIIGTDLSRYKIVDHWQFACDFMSTIRVRKLPVVLQKNDEQIIVSPAYTAFEVIDSNELHPEYLMMWFRREEFDRYAYFCCDSAVRGGFNWDELCDVKLPVPSIDKQREIVKEYNTIVNRIKLIEEINQKLEETAQALYKHWFVDFEFPNENGQPYKSSGGKMVYNNELDKNIPEVWEVKAYTEVVELKGGGTPRTTEPTFWGGNIPFFTPKDIDDSYYCLITEKYITGAGLDNCSSKLYPKNTVFVTARGTVGAISLAGSPMAMNQSCYAILGNDIIGAYYIHQLTLETIKSLKKEAVGAVFKALVTKDFEGKKVLDPGKVLSKAYDSKITPIYDTLLNNSKQINALKKLTDLVLQKISKVESIQTTETT